jgi:hypothetical protein
MPGSCVSYTRVGGGTKSTAGYAAPNTKNKPAGQAII